jgi:XapX domain-containing protein
VVKPALGLLLAALIGSVCRLSGIPVPAPPASVGALLVLAMTTGYLLMARYASHRPARTGPLCGGPSGAPASRES